MALDNSWNMYIFRDGRTKVPGAKLTDELIEGLLSLQVSDSSRRRSELLDLLLRAGELECALADSNSPHADLAATITDDLAAALVSNIRVRATDLTRRVSTITPPDSFAITPPEGFAYYALHPLDYVDLISRVPTRSPYVGVVGIRSVGTTISAVVQAALRGQGVHVERITLRPTGHPYDRKASLDPGQSRWLAALRSRQAEFLVVDEGPGMSGSSFLSVAETLLSNGVSRSDIALVGSREPDPTSLTAPQAATRWPSFRSYFTQPTKYVPKATGRYIAGGIWRAEVFANEDLWPASWLQMERLKFLSKDGSQLFKFEGIGRFGGAVLDRAVQVHQNGFGPEPLGREEGFSVYQMVRGRTLRSADADSSVLKRLAEYCAFRSCTMRVPVHATPELQTMLRFNAHEEFGATISNEISELRIERPVVADGRMLPHKWINADGTLLKVDASAHGDDHFFPGPTDIAWDLAGTIVEWGLNYSKSRYFLHCYRQLSNDNVDHRLPAYLLAYSVFRMAYCKMAAAASRGIQEEPRLVRDYHRYRAHAQQYIEQATNASLQPTTQRRLVTSITDRARPTNVA
jgi:hypothetical protein